MKGLEKWEVLLVLVRTKMHLRDNVAYQFLKFVLVFQVQLLVLTKFFHQ